MSARKKRNRQKSRLKIRMMAFLVSRDFEVGSSVMLVIRIEFRMFWQSLDILPMTIRDVLVEAWVFYP